MCLCVNTNKVFTCWGIQVPAHSKSKQGVIFIANACMRLQHPGTRACRCLTPHEGARTGNRSSFSAAAAPIRMPVVRCAMCSEYALANSLGTQRSTFGIRSNSYQELPLHNAVRACATA